MPAHPFEADRRVQAGIPVCRCGLAMGAALHHPARRR